VAKIKKWVGVPVSIGVAQTKTLAKIASHFAKKHKGYKGVCMMETDSKRLKALSLTPIDDVWGIGRRLAPKMLAKGIKTALDFVQRPREWVGETFNINVVRTWEELHGRPCLEEEKEERRKSICTSRSFADMIEDEKELQLRISDFAAMSARKLRQEGSAAYDVTTFLYTNRFREDLQQYFPSATIRLEVAANSAQEIIGAALRGFRIVYRAGYRYKKAGVIVNNIVPENEIQGSLFGFDDSLRQRQDKLSEVMDAINTAADASGNSLLRLAVQRPGHYADGIRSEFRSNLYSTSLDEIIKVR
jgi:DNA polymerase V